MRVQDTKSQYAQHDAAKAFASFSSQASGEKALLWSWLRARVVNAVGVAPTPRCLDFGCGSGWLTRQLVKEFAAYALGYDPSAEMIAQASEQLDAQYFTNSFDCVRASSPFHLVFCVFVLPAVPDRHALQTVFDQMTEVLPGAGRVCIVTANPEAVFSRHAFYTSHAPRNKPKESDIYLTDILNADGSFLLTVQDHYWPAKAIITAGEHAGLRLIQDSRLADPISDSDPKNFPYRIWDFVKDE